VVLDPVTLAVLDRERVFDHQKLFDPNSDSQDLGQNFDKKILAARVVHLIEKSVAKAVSQTELAGKVEIREIREVAPDKVGR